MICPCSDRRKHRLVRQLQGHNGAPNIMALNPSTDPLVSHTQYEVSVSDVPRFEDEEERKKLMHDKDWYDNSLLNINIVIFSTHLLYVNIERNH